MMAATKGGGERGKIRLVLMWWELGGFQEYLIGY